MWRGIIVIIVKKRDYDFFSLFLIVFVTLILLAIISGEGTGFLIEVGLPCIVIFMIGALLYVLTDM